MRYDHIDLVAKPVSRIVQGTIMLREEEQDWGFQLLDGIFEQGVNTFDSAHGYGSGECERVLGRWIESRGLRDDVVILTKGSHHNRDRKRVTPFDITSDLHDSLARCRTDYIDIYVLHRDDPDVPVGPIVEVLNEHRAAGLIHCFGGSNWNPRRIQEANAYAKQQHLEPFTVSSPNFSLAEQIEAPWPDCITISGPRSEDARRWYQQQQMPLFTWSSLAQGFFSGRFTRETFATYKGNLPDSCIRAYCHEPNFQRLDRAHQLAADKGVTVPQIALAFTMSHPLNVFALIGVFHPDECKANIEALDLMLTAEEREWLDLRRETRTPTSAKTL